MPTLRRYILRKFEVVNLKDVSPRKLLDFGTYLTDERFNMKSVRAFIDASFRAMMQDSRKIDQLLESDPLPHWMRPVLPSPKSDPFTEEERNKVIQRFKEKRPPL